MKSSINRRQSTIGLIGKVTFCILLDLAGKYCFDLQNPSVDSPVRNGDGSPSTGSSASRDLGGSSREAGGSSRDLGGFSTREVGGSSREPGTSSSPIRSQGGSDLKSYNSDARSRERWRSMARRGSLAEGARLEDIHLRLST